MDKGSYNKHHLQLSLRSCWESLATVVQEIWPRYPYMRREEQEPIEIRQGGQNNEKALNHTSS